MFRRRNTPNAMPGTPVKSSHTSNVSTPNTPKYAPLPPSANHGSANVTATGNGKVYGNDNGGVKMSVPSPAVYSQATSIPTPALKYAPVIPMARQVMIPTSSSSLATDGGDRTANGTIIADRYRLEKTIGKGSYGKVKLAQDMHKMDRRVAIKFIAKSQIKKQAHITRIRREISYLTALYHQNIVRLWETLESPTEIILVMEYVPGADLFDRIVSHRDQRYGEAEARAIFHQIASAVGYCHDNRIIHRDLKPENVMVDEKNQVKLIDFGFANIYHPRGYLETNCGSPLYAAPEIVQGVRYTGPEVDVWSLGVILFAMVTGTLPFEDEQLKGLYAKICAGQYVIPSYLSAGVRDLIRSMLEIDSRKRLTIASVIAHPWVRGFHSGSLHHNQPPLFPRQVVINPRDDIIRKMVEEFNLPGDFETIRIQVRTDADDPATAIYHLLEAKEEREQVRPTSTVPPPRRLSASGAPSGFVTPQGKPAHLMAAARRGQATTPFAQDDGSWICVSPNGDAHLISIDDRSNAHGYVNHPRSATQPPAPQDGAYTAAGRFMAQTVNSLVDNLSALRKVRLTGAPPNPTVPNEEQPNVAYYYNPPV